LKRGKNKITTYIERKEERHNKRTRLKGNNKQRDGEETKVGNENRKGGNSKTREK
jgi:hypothetical protein